MNNVFIWIASWKDNHFSEKEHLIQSLPSHLQKEVRRYKYCEEQHQSLVSKVLVQRMLKAWGYDYGDLKYIQNQKPYIHYPNTPPFFSYSKSIGKVVLGWSWEIDVGVDIEYLDRKTDWRIFESRLSSSVWSKIIHEEDALNCFLWSWTHIEAILKLKGIGLANHIKLVHYKEKQWFFEEQKIYTKYFFHEKHLITIAAYEPFHFEVNNLIFE